MKKVLQKSFVKIVLLIAIGVVTGLVVIETCLRIAGISYPMLYTCDEYCGAALNPGAEGWWRKEGQAYIKINSDGLRDRTHAKRKPPNTLRIAVLGDSYTEAFQVPTDKTFWAILENKLSVCDSVAGRKVEVINFGVSGYGTAQELMMLRHRVWDYHPDIVLLAFLTGNDIRNNLRSLEKNPMRPYFVFQKDKLALDDSFLHSRAYALCQSWMGRTYQELAKYSRVFQVVREFVMTIRNQRRARQQADVIKGQQGELGLDNSIYLPPVSDEWNEAWRVTEALVKTMRDEVEARGANFLLVTLSSGIQVHPDPEKRKQFMGKLHVDNIFYPDHRIKAFAERQDIAVLNLAPAFQAYAEKYRVFLHGFPNTQLGGGHWNENGHRLGGEMIAEKICTDLLLPETQEQTTTQLRKKSTRN